MQEEFFISRRYIVFHSATGWQNWKREQCLMLLITSKSTKKQNLISLLY